jgi:hypothetical protein
LVHREPSFSAKQTTPAAARAGSAARESVRRRSGFVQVGLCLLKRTHAGISTGARVLISPLRLRSPEGQQSGRSTTSYGLQRHHRRDRGIRLHPHLPEGLPLRRDSA